MAQRASTPPKRLGTRISRSVNTIYQAETDGEVECNYTNASTDTVLYAETDGATPPTVEVGGQMSAGHANPKRLGLSFLVKSGDYWNVISSAGSPTVFWIPWGP